jgi:histidine triad (HIT) family protein
MSHTAENDAPSCTCRPARPPFDWSCPSHGQEATDEWTDLREKRCVFCLIAVGDADATMVEEGEHHVAFIPIGPHVPGHVLFVPRNHLPDATTNPEAAALIFEEAARYVRDLGVQANIITSVGPRATQSVPHLHVHVVPRWPGDGLDTRWPWIAATRVIPPVVGKPS